MEYLLFLPLLYLIINNKSENKNALLIDNQKISIGSKNITNTDKELITVPEFSAPKLTLPNLPNPQIGNKLKDFGLNTAKNVSPSFSKLGAGLAITAPVTGIAAAILVPKVKRWAKDFNVSTEEMYNRVITIHGIDSSQATWAAWYRAASDLKGHKGGVLVQGGLGWDYNGSINNRWYLAMKKNGYQGLTTDQIRNESFKYDTRLKNSFDAQKKRAADKKALIASNKVTSKGTETVRVGFSKRSMKFVVIAGKKIFQPIFKYGGTTFNASAAARMAWKEFNKLYNSI